MTCTIYILAPTYRSVVFEAIIHIITPNQITYVDNQIVDVKAQMNQVTPLYANSIEELEANGDTSKLYVLPDGQIYGYIKTLGDVGNIVGTYTNWIPKSTDTDGNLFNEGQGWKADTRLNSSGVQSVGKYSD